ncbi:MAG TPA: hypothetical protein ENK18_23540 [Deltaproteobacteria bacterium]|nr:hypothetical protein [Deltaproteobacteria bacterium]
MQLPYSMRDALVDDLDEYLEAISSTPDTEAVVGYVIELFETYAEDKNLDEIVPQLEEEGQLDGSLSEVLEEEMSSNDEFEYTGEEIVSLLERLCDIEWETEDEGGDEEEEEEEEEDASFF